MMVNDRIEFHQNRATSLAFLVLALGFIALSVGLLTRPSIRPKIAGVAGIIGFGLFVPWIVVQISSRGPRVVIDQTGIDDRRWRTGTIDWSDVLNVEAVPMGRHRFVCIRLRDPSSILALLPAHLRLIAQVNKRLGYGDIAISFTALTPGFDEAWAVIQRYVKTDS